MIDRKEATIHAMEEYGKYCAEQAWKESIATDTCKKISDIIHGNFKGVRFEDWWNEFKEKEDENQT